MTGQWAGLIVWLANERLPRFDHGWCRDPAHAIVPEAVVVRPI